MKKLPIFIAIGSLLLFVGGYYYYQQFVAKRNPNILDIIPANALLVYESDVCTSCVERVSESPVWEIIEKAAFYSKSDTLKKSLVSFYRDADKVFASLHATKKDDFDFVFYIPTHDEKKSPVSFKDFSNKKYKLTRREFTTVEIHEVGYQGQVFSWAMLDEIWVGSFTPFLIEDAIRTFTSKKTGFRKNIESIQKFPVMSGDAGNIYIKTSSFSEWLSIFATGRYPLIEAFAQSSVLDIKQENDSFILNGFTADSIHGAQSALSIFQDQKPVSFHLKNFVPERAVALQTFGISRGTQFQKNLEAFVRRKDPVLTDSLLWIERRTGVNTRKLYENLAGEIGIMHFESSRDRGISKTLIIETIHPEVWLRAFSLLADKFSTDTVFYERYANYEIQEVPIYRFPEKLFWPLVVGFDQSFYTVKENFVLIADDVDELKKVLNDIEQESTWGKSVSINKFLDATLLESNISLYINTPRIWNILAENLHPKWKQFIRDNHQVLRSLQLGGIQLSHLNNSYYTNILWNYKAVTSDGKNKNTPRERFVTNFNAAISSIFTVRSHINRNDELLVQDSLSELSLVSDEGEVLWKISVGDRIVSDVEQIDFFSNGKLQYFFATRDALHVIDRLGNYVSSYPLHLPGVEIAHASVIDYDHSKKYRFLIAESSGKLWMYDKEGNNLDGWNPRELNGPLALPPQHHRIKGKDYIIAFKKDGTVYLMNRRGETLQNFPLKLDANISGGYFLETGRTSEDTYFVVVSNNGYRIRFNLEGKILNRETLLKTSVATRFTLINENANKNYVIQQFDERQFNILDESGKKIISNPFIGLNTALVRYYDFGSGNIYTTITDTVQGLTYLYDSAGNLMTVTPITSTKLSLRPMNTDDIRLFIVHGKSLTIQPF